MATFLLGLLPSSVCRLRFFALSLAGSAIMDRCHVGATKLAPKPGGDEILGRSVQTIFR